MKRLALLALCSMLLAGCWFYSRPEGDPNSGCEKTTYGVAIASTSSTSCPPEKKDLP
jgi:hypothetical protein